MKPLLYLFRVLLTGIHLMRSGEVEANLLKLNESYHLPYIADLIAQKTQGAEQQALHSGDLAFYEHEFHVLRERLVRETEATQVAEEPTARPALNDLLIRVRLQTITSS